MKNIFVSLYLIKTNISLFFYVVKNDISISTSIFVKKIFVFVWNILNISICWRFFMQNSHNIFENELLISFMFFILLTFLITFWYSKYVKRQYQICKSFVDLTKTKIFCITIDVDIKNFSIKIIVRIIDRKI